MYNFYLKGYMDFLDVLADAPDDSYKNIIPGVVFTKKGPLVQGNYARDVIYENAWTDAICQWRGHIYDLEHRTLIARPFKKFFNLDEQPSSTVKALQDIPGIQRISYAEKLDGTMIIVYKRPGESDYRIATRGSLEPLVNSNYPNYHAAARELLQQKCPNFANAMHPHFTYIFELIWKPGREGLVTKYASDDIYLIGLVDNLCGQDIAYHVVKQTALELGFSYPKQKTFATLADCIAWATQNQDDCISEGMIVTFEDALTVLGRVKIKTEQYKTIHRMLFEAHTKYVLPLILNGNIAEYMQRTPKELLPRIVETLQKYYYTVNKCIALYKPICHISDQKEFALTVQTSIPKQFQKFMYALRSEGSINSRLKPDDLVIDY